MRTLSICYCAMLWLGCSSLLAAQFGGQAGHTGTEALSAAEKRLAALDGEALATVPERTWKTIEVASTQTLLKNVELVDRKLRATVRLQLPTELNTAQARELAYSWRILSNETRALFASPGGSLVFIHETGTGQRPSTSDYFGVLIERTPAEQRPAAELLDYLKSPAANLDITLGGSEKEIYLAVLGKTQDEVESRAKAIVQLLDAAVHQSTRRELLTTAEMALANAKAILKEQQRLEAELKAVREGGQETASVAPEVLTHLQAQQLTLGIEIEGLEAELKACDQLLQEKQRTEQERATARDTRVRSELELARQRAKLARTSTLIKEAQEQAGRQREKTKLNREIASAAAKVQSEVRLVTTLATVIDLLAPPPAVDDAIRIAPIEWVTR